MYVMIIQPPLLRRILLLPPCPARTVVVHLTLYRLFPGRISWHQPILDSYTAFSEQQPFAVATAFPVGGWQQRTLPMSFDIIVDSFLEHLEFGARARLHSLVRSPKCRVSDLVVVGCFIPCSHNQKVHPITE